MQDRRDSKSRDMASELREFQDKKRAAKKRNDENDPFRNPASANMLLKGQSPPSTPTKMRGHVNAVSPLAEVCQNIGSLTDERKRCRPSPMPSPVAQTPLSLSGSPEGGTCGSRCDIRGRQSTGSLVEELKKCRPSPMPSPVAQAAPSLGGTPERSSCGSRCDTQGRPKESLPKRQIDIFSDISPDEGSDICTGELDTDRVMLREDDCIYEVRAWAESMEVPCVPPSSPMPQYANHQLFRRRSEDRFEIDSFLRRLPNSLIAACPEIQDRCIESREVDSSLDVSLLAASEAQEDDSDVDTHAPEADEHSRLVEDINNHATMWPPQTILDMEDHLSRSHDISTFLFFEVRDRAHARTADDRPLIDDQLESIPEYPPNWSQWQIESSRSRSAMRSRKLSTGRQSSEKASSQPAWTF